MQKGYYSDERRKGEVAGMVEEVKIKYNDRVSSTKKYIAHDNMFENRGPIKTLFYNPLILKFI